MISLVFHAILRLKDVSPPGRSPISQNQSGRLFAFFRFRGYAMRCVINGGMFCQTRIKRMCGELEGIVHNARARV